MFAQAQTSEKNDTLRDIFEGHPEADTNADGVLAMEKAKAFEKKMKAGATDKNGYLTSVTGKWQLATLQHHPIHIRDAGFDSWCVWKIWCDGAKTDRH